MDDKVKYYPYEDYSEGVEKMPDDYNDGYDDGDVATRDASEFPPSADGGIAFRARPESQPVRRCAGEAVCEDGVYTAGVVTDDGAEAKAVFTVEEKDGRYRIADIRFEE